MVDYIKKFSAKVMRRGIASFIFLLLIALVFLATCYLLGMPVDQQIRYEYGQIGAQGSRPQHILIDAYDVLDYLTEEGSNPEHILFLEQAGGERFNVILTDAEINQLVEQGTLEKIVSRLNSSDASEYAEGVRNYAMSVQAQDSEESSFFYTVAGLSYYKSPYGFGFWGSLGAAGLFLVFAIMGLARAISAARKKGALGQDLEYVSRETGMDVEDVVQMANERLNDEDALVFANKKFRLTNEWMLFVGERNVRLMRLEDVVWIYRHTLQHRTYGIKTGSVHSIVAYGAGSKEGGKVPLKNMNQADEVFFELQKRTPYAIVGFDKNRDKMARKDYFALLDEWMTRRAMMQQGQPTDPSSSTL